MIGVVLIAILVLVLAWANGANDVAKGVATLAGNGTANARRAVVWGTLWTVLGGLTAVIWGGALVTTFSSGYLAPGFRVDLAFVAGTLLGASGAILAATQLGLPVSTTHALLGGVVGAVLVATGPGGLHAAAIANKALLPLLLSPLIAIGLCWGLLFAARRIAHLKPARFDATRTGIEQQMRPDEYGRHAASVPGCNDDHKIWTGVHWFSSAATSFARGLNDVPKIAAFLILTITLVPGLAYVLHPVGPSWPIVLVALVMGLGGLWGGFRVLDVLAHRVASLDAGNGVVANLGTSFVVLLATPLGVPVSTTHVSGGALMGIRWADKAKPGQIDALASILFAWLVTLPVAGILSGMSVWLVQLI